MGNPSPSKATRIGLFALLCWLYGCLHLDRQMLGILAESVKSALDLTDRQMGTLTGSAFSFVYALLGLHFGRLADRSDRLRLVIIGACVWSIASMAAALAREYGELVAARSAVAVGEAIATGAAVALMAELAGKRYRALAAGIFFAGAYLGAGSAAVLGGSVLSWFATSGSTEGWRAALVLAGAPGLLGAAALAFFRAPRSPTIGTSHLSRAHVTTALVATSLFVVSVQMICPPEYSVPLGAAAAVATGFVWVRDLRFADTLAYRATLGSKSFALLIIAFSATLFVDSAAEFWMIPYAQRHFHAGFVRVGSEFGTLLIVGGIGGCLGGGWIGDQWQKRSASGRVWTALIAILLETGAIIAGLAMPDYSGLVACFALLCVAAGAWTGVAAAIGLDILPREHRGTGTAAYFLITTLLGPGLGPFVVGLGSDHIGSLGKALAASCAVMGIAAVSLIRLGQQLKSRGA